MNSTRSRVLVVDDEALNRDALAAMLQALGHEAETAEDGPEALAKLRLEIDLVLLDLAMPCMDGFEVAQRIRQDEEIGDVPIIMVTGRTSREDRLRAVEAGANDFIAKPVDLTELRIRIASLLRMKAAQDAIKRHQGELEEIVERRTAYLRRTLDEMVQAQRRTYEAHLDTIRRLALAAEYKDPETAAHIRRMGHYSALLIERLGLPPKEIEVVRVASPMHDVGKIGIPDAILLKSGPLTEEERKTMEQHAIIGARILADSPSEVLQAGQVIALSHHEKWDGSGYPQRLAGAGIPLYGRVCALADVFDALTTDRPYRKAFPLDIALDVLRDGRGKHFDSELTDLFFDSLPEIDAIRLGHYEDGAVAPGAPLPDEVAVAPVPHSPLEKGRWTEGKAAVSNGARK